MTRGPAHDPRTPADPVPACVGTVPAMDALFDEDEVMPAQPRRPGRTTGAGADAQSGTGARPTPRPDAPLAARMRPRTLAEYVGQTEVVGEGTTLRRLLERDELGSVILWGPPGSGKTSLAAVIANSTQAAWEELSAVSAGVKDVRATIQRAEERQQAARRTVLFLDEIHRFNKAQQDALLPAVESGAITLVGATTENPFFEVNAPLLSRCRLIRLDPLTDEDVGEILDRAVTDPERGYGERIQLDEEARRHLVGAADGDARIALTSLEAAVDAAGGPGAAPAVAEHAAGPADTAGGPADPAHPGPRTITPEDVVAAFTGPRLRYDKAGDAHYDEVSAFIKSMRGGDPDASVYWLMRMLEAGEDPRFLARRMVILASEDVGLADRTALPTAVAAFEALDRVGLPEATYNLVHAAVALATAPKSNALKNAIAAGRRAVAEHPNDPVPPHLRDAHYRGARRIGHGVGYRYPHDYPGAHVAQQYLPHGLVGQRLYHPTDHGDEDEVASRLAAWRAAEEAASGAPDHDEEDGT
jgi:putative ATPase